VSHQLIQQLDVITTAVLVCLATCEAKP